MQVLNILIEFRSITVRNMGFYSAFFSPSLRIFYRGRVYKYE